MELNELKRVLSFPKHHFTYIMQWVFDVCYGMVDCANHATLTDEQQQQQQRHVMPSSKITIDSSILRTLK